MDSQVNNSVYISSATTTVVCPKACVLHSIVVGETANGAITILDGSTTKGVLKASIAEGTYIFDMATAGPLSITTAAASKITVNYRPS